MDFVHLNILLTITYNFYVIVNNMFAKCKAKYLENIPIPKETTPTVASNLAAAATIAFARQRKAGMACSLGVLDIERVVIAAVRAALQGVALPVQSTTATVS